jgi:hypothetical protein
MPNSPLSDLLPASDSPGSDSLGSDFEEVSSSTDSEDDATLPAVLLVLESQQAACQEAATTY